jgi:hypothetical protein
MSFSVSAGTQRARKMRPKMSSLRYQVSISHKLDMAVTYGEWSKTLSSGTTSLTCTFVTPHSISNVVKMTLEQS